MDESRELQKLYSFMQMALYGIVFLDVILNVLYTESIWHQLMLLFGRLKTLTIFSNPVYTKLLTVVVILLVGIGTKAKKNINLNPKTQIFIPLALGLVLIFASPFLLPKAHDLSLKQVFPHTNMYGAAYIFLSFLGTIITNTAVDNVSKLVKSGLGKDKWNIEGESFMQDKVKVETPTSLNIPMVFYYKGKVHHGYININPFRGTFVIGTPGSGKSFGIINPAIREFIRKGFTMCLYDFKYPDLGQIAYYHYLLQKKKGNLKKHNFYVINIDDISKSCRINPLAPQYVQTLAAAQEISEALIEALKKGDKTGGADQFFTQSGVNFFACSVYFWAKHKEGKYSSLPHIMAFLNRSYEEIFTVLLTNPELASLLSPFMSAFNKKAFDQLEGQIGTLKIFLSRLATKESFWVFSENDFNLKISDPNNPAILVLANNPATQSINSALYALVINRITRLINDKGNLPTSIIADEVPTLFIHKIENLIATARSNKVAVLLGLQELPQFKQQYGRETAETIASVIGNVLSGSVRDKGTLEWLERMVGKIKQTNDSLNIDHARATVGMSERLDALIPAGKIASLKTGHMVGMIARDADEKTDMGKDYVPSAINCKINLDMKAIKLEEENYPEMPVFYNFKGDKDKFLLKNYEKINKEVDGVINELMYAS
ncbi:MAG: type IV secretion system DNA-binding domain-containing protein [Draconibacterium sp.]